MSVVVDVDLYIDTRLAGGLLMIDDGDVQEKKKYGSPTVTVINLRPDEAVLANCKTSHTAGAVAGFDCRHASGCNVIGS
jgi:hypothetical protein